jgi:hypothetical protein
MHKGPAPPLDAEKAKERTLEHMKTPNILSLFEVMRSQAELL